MATFISTIYWTFAQEALYLSNSDPLARFGHWITARSDGFLRMQLAFIPCGPGPLSHGTMHVV
jgi:hypothetical protein